MATPGLVDRAGRFKGSDYVQFYVMGSLARGGRIDALYDAQAHLAEARDRIDPALGLYASHPNYGPQVAMAFRPLAALPYGWSLAVFLTLASFCYAFSVWIVWRECEALREHGAMVALLAAASPLFLTVVRYGQASAFALTAFSLAYAGFRRGRMFLAGLAIGCLAYKPQLGVIIGLVVLASRQWRVAGGALVSTAAQLVVGWLAAGSSVLGQYFGELRTLILNPSLVELYPSEVHSFRGFLQLLVPGSTAATVCALAGLVVAAILAIRSWDAKAPLAIRMSLAIVLTILASPHLISYDLLLLTLPLLLLADWTAEQPEHRLAPTLRVLTALLYFAPFSGMIVARLTGVQISVVVMTLLSWRLYQISTESRAIVAPRWASASSQNSTTRGWRSSAA
jgi:alpha-1,2-mannosyltransferase